MTKFISIEETKESKKETVFTHYLSSSDGWLETTLTPRYYKKVLYLGECMDDGDMFACYTYQEIIVIYKGTKGDEFNQ